MEASGAEAVWREAITGEVVVTETEGVTGTVTIALAAWWRAERRRFLSLSASPRWRGCSGGELEDEKETVGAGGDGEGKGESG